MIKIIAVSVVLSFVFLGHSGILAKADTVSINGEIKLHYPAQIIVEEEESKDLSAKISLLVERRPTNYLVDVDSVKGRYRIFVPERVLLNTRFQVRGHHHCKIISVFEDDLSYSGPPNSVG